MNHQQILLRNTKYLFSFILICFCFISCKNNKYGELYFFEQEEMSTTVALTCDDIHNLNGLKKIVIKDKQFKNLILNSKESINQSYKQEPDVRYKIIIKSDTFCLDYSGKFIHNSLEIGKINYMNEIEKYINKNKRNSTYVTKPSPKPWRKDKRSR